MTLLKILTTKFNEQIDVAAKAIEKGKVLILPTDTVYGMITDAKNEKAVKKIFKIKGREFQKTLPVFVKDIKMAKEFALIDKKREKFLNKVWPGKTTVVLRIRPEAKNLLKFGVVSSDEKIGLRIPKYKLINLLLEKLNFPLTGTSANVSGKPPSAKIADILEQFKNRNHQPDLAIDVGDLPRSKPSKVLDLTVFPPKVLRK